MSLKMLLGPLSSDLCFFAALCLDWVFAGIAYLSVASLWFRFSVSTKSKAQWSESMVTQEDLQNAMDSVLVALLSGVGQWG